MARRHTVAAVCLAVALCLAGAARAQQAPALPAATGAAAAGAAATAPAGPAPIGGTGGSPSEYITIIVTNECSKTLLAAVAAAGLDGKFEAQGFWRLAPGESAEAAHTRDRTYFVYAHELGDPECTLGCWAGSADKTLQGETWPFVEKTVKPGVGLGSTVNHKFTC